MQGVVTSVVREEADGLRRRCWEFGVDENPPILVLRYYRLEERKTRRHGWKTVERFGLHPDRYLGYEILATVPNPPADVVDEMLAHLRNTLRIGPR